jgi:Zinc carboxypeptidase
MPFSHGNVQGGNPVVLTNLANRVAAEIRRINPARNYQVGVGGALRTAQYGTSTDYAIGYEGIQYVYTIMLPSGGVTGFDPPAASISGIAGETFYGLLQFAYYAIGQ